MMVDVTPEVKTRISALWSMANITTLTGLLGTITGLIRTFAAVGDANPAERQKQLSEGIAEAMYNTAYGLSIALVCMVAHLLLSTASKKVIADVESFSLKFENLLGDGPNQSGSGTASKG
jgi:biopolymer transport protein ExbB/TolQ